MHDESASASVFSFTVETVTLAGTAAPGEVPVAILTRLFATITALARPRALEEVAPRLPSGARNCDSAQAEATVVTSFRTAVVDAAMSPHAPIGAISHRSAFAEEAPATWPPSASK